MIWRDGAFYSWPLDIGGRRVHSRLVQGSHRPRKTSMSVLHPSRRLRPMRRSNPTFRVFCRSFATTRLNGMMSFPTPGHHKTIRLPWISMYGHYSLPSNIAGGNYSCAPRSSYPRVWSKQYDYHETGG